jgi:Lon protease-like protein
MIPMSERLAMFPLNRGLVPGALLPLRLFEPRYLKMLDDCLDATSEFGVVLIERGSEVGGGDQRYDVGTVAAIVGVRTIEDGTTLMIARGTERLRVSAWLEDDPYPQALIDRLVEVESDIDSEVRRSFDAEFARAMGLLSELGVNVTAAQELPFDDLAALHQAISLIGVEPHDRQRLIEIDDLAQRFDAALQVVREANELSELRLADG